MENVSVYDTGIEAQSLTIQTLRENIENFCIKRISISYSVLLNNSKLIHYTDEKNPITYSDNMVFGSNLLTFDKSFYQKNKIEIDALILRILKNTNESWFTLDDDLAQNRGLLIALFENPNVKRIILKDVVLTMELFELAKKYGKEIKTDSVVPELENVFSPVIVNNMEKTLIADHNYARISNADEYYIKSSLNNEEIENLKYFQNGVEFIFEGNDYDNIFKVINKLIELKKEFSVKIKVEDKSVFNTYIFNNLDKVTRNDIFVVCSSSENPVEISDYLKYEKRLFDMVAPAMNLSPFERYLYAYNIVKKYKKYKEYKESFDKRSFARNLYDILDNEYIVCVGFSYFLEDLLDKLGIANSEYSLTVDVGLDYIPDDVEMLPETFEVGGEEVPTEVDRGNHSRRLINLVDPKYGIDGIYVADPTWDNDLDKDFYVYALLTPNETVSNSRYLFLSFLGISDLIFVDNIEEFFNKVNVWLDKNKKSDSPEMALVQQLFGFIKSLDMEFYSNLISKYPQFVGSSSEINMNDFSNFVTDVGEYFVNKCTHNISGEVLKSGIREVYKKCYGRQDNEELDNEVDNIMKYNKKRFELVFPKRYKILPDGTKVVYENEYNKFDLEESQNIEL